MKLEKIEAWHALAADSVLDRLEADIAGLSQHEAEERLARHGPNALPSTAATHPLLRFLAQFNSALIYFLLAAAFAAALLGHLVDALVTGVVVLVNAIVGFAQEGKAERALGAIRDMIAPHATVLRDGARRTVSVPDLVPGDIVMLEAGDRVPADLRLLRARGLLIIFTSAPLRPRKTQRSPANGSREKLCCTIAAKLCMPRRISVWPIAIHTRAPAGIIAGP